MLIRERLLKVEVLVRDQIICLVLGNYRLEITA
jgi:hypothetical protein